MKSTEGMKGFRGRRLLRSIDYRTEGIFISLWGSKEDLQSYIDSAKRKDLGNEAERLYMGEYWVKQFEVRSSTV